MNCPSCDILSVGMAPPELMAVTANMVRALGYEQFKEAMCPKCRNNFVLAMLRGVLAFETKHQTTEDITPEQAAVAMAEYAKRST